MADEAAAPPVAAGDTGLESRVSSLEHGQTSISERLDQVLGFLRDTPDTPAEPEAERPELSIADEIKRQLDARDRRRAGSKPAEPAAPAAAELAEKPPVAPLRRLTKAIWGEP
jgi:hypothetical protein